jgi:hypothetical protein
LSYEKLLEFFEDGLLNTENLEIRGEVCKQLKALFENRCGDHSDLKVAILQKLIFNLLPKTENRKQRSHPFLETLMGLIQCFDAQDLKPLDKNV